MAHDQLPTGHRHRAIVGINVTPMVDVMLVLLVIFIVTARFVATHGLPLDLPKAALAEEVQVLLAVTIDPDGRLLLDDVEVEGLDALARGAAQKMEASPQARVVIAADGGTPHRRVMAVMDALRGAGIDKIAFAADKAPPSEGKAPGGEVPRTP